MLFEHPFFARNNSFESFSTSHFAPIVIAVVLCIFLCLMGKYKWSKTTNVQISRGLALLTSFTVVAYVVILMLKGEFNYKTDLPLDICNLMGLLLPVVMWNPKYKYHEILYFLILAGTIQAVITPFLYQDFPNFVYIKFWISHLVLIIYTIFITVAMDMKPTMRSILKTFIAMNVYVLIMMVVNYILGSNYVFVMRKPPTESVLDYMGDWPWYILAGQFVGILFSFIVYLPIYFTRKRN